MKKIIDIFKEKKSTVSIELFPPKTEEAYQNLLATVAQFAELQPDFFSCTYGAGGGSREKTFDIVEHIQKKHQIPAMAHLTCVLNTKEDIKNILDDIKTRGITNVLALRGDPPKENPDWQPGADNFKYSCDLCAFIRKNFADSFGIGVAGFPEGHLLCPDRERDAQYLKMKIDAGADFVITQLFYINEDYFSYVARLKKLGITVPVLPGILPVTNYQGLLRFTSNCGTTVPKAVKVIFEPIQDDKEKTYQKGIEFAVKQCRELLAGGAPGLHFYSLNKYNPTAEIIKLIK